MSNLSSERIFVSVDTLDDIKKHWLSISSDQNFFLSWFFIEEWVKLTIPFIDIYAVVTRRNNKTVGIGLFTIKQGTTKQFKQCVSFLHRTGIECLDQIWVEYNNFKTDQAHREIIIQHMLDFWLNQKDIQQVHLQVCKKDIADTWIKQLPQNAFYEFVEPEFGAHCHIDTKYQYPSKNISKQIKQTEKFIKSQCKQINFRHITKASEKVFYINFSKKHHITKWKNTDTPSGWENPFFKTFHNQLLSKNKNEELCSTEVFSLHLDNQLVGIIYCLRKDKWLGFYMAHLKPFDNNKMRIGLYMHHLCIQWCLEHDIQCYDFMAGNERYKKQMGNKIEYYGHLIVYKKNIRNRLLRTLKKIIRK